MRLAEEPIRKVTINIFTSDYEFLKGRTRWHEDVRNAIRAYVNNQKRQKAQVPPVAEGGE